VPEYTWQPRGTSGRALAGPRTTEGWVVPLGGLNRFEQSLTADELQGLKEQVLAVSASLERAHGRPTYFPFYLYGRRQLRAQQGYLVKFPVELFDVVPNVGAAKVDGEGRDPDEVPEHNESSKRRVPGGPTTRVQDPQLRSAIENHAVERAVEYYKQLGGLNLTKLGKPYDLSLLLGGVLRHVEVKGSSLFIETVELTINEVAHAKSYQPTDLIVVDGIEWSRSGSRIVTAGGRFRVWSDWTPSDQNLSAQRFAYMLQTEELGFLQLGDTGI
jgi:hypothetical protein